MTAQTGPGVERRYELLPMDTARWEGFAHRPGDVLICTSYKAGTTWMQMICALLVFGRPELPSSLSELSPWLERRGTPKDEVHARLAAQTHQRFIKSHSPLDALPWRDDALYLYSGRDPRDVFMSMQNHLANAHPEFLGRMAQEALASGALHSPDGAPPPGLPDDLNERFHVWLTSGSVPWEQDGFPFWSHLRHAQTFWEHRHLPNVHFFHYDDLLTDLDAEMRRIAALLGVSPDEGIWPELLHAASFDAMKQNADRTAPDSTEPMWLSNRDFFHKGQSGRWRGQLDDTSLALYERVMSERHPPELRAFLERGRGAADPKRV